MSLHVIRLFVASTFQEFFKERELLREQVFPKVADLCRSHGAVFQPIDLRWGINEEAMVDHRTVSICQQEIKRCVSVGTKPNFLLLLGNAWGWCPLPSEIGSDAFASIISRLNASQDPQGRRRARRLSHWYKLDNNAVPPSYVLKTRRGRSLNPGIWAALERRLRDDLWLGAVAPGVHSENAIAMFRPIVEIEAEAGILSRPGPHDDCLVVFRDIAQAPEKVGDVAASGYDNELELIQEKRLVQLKQRLRSAVGDQLMEFKVDAHDGTLPDSYYHDFENTIYDRICSVVLEQLSAFEDIPRQLEDFEEHTRIRERYLRSYTPRRDFDHRIWEAIESDDAAPVTPIVIVGPSGSGKTALIASLSAQAQTRLTDTHTYYHFAGATPRSGNPEQLIADLLQELGETVEDTASPDALPVMMRTLRRALEDESRDRLCLFIDGIDRFDLFVPSSSVDWLPVRLGRSTRVVISVSEGEVAAHLKSLLPPEAIFAIPPLTAVEAQDIVSRSLALQRRQVQPHQMAALVDIAVEHDPRPLYLRLAAYLAAGWDHNSDPSLHLPKNLPDAIHAAITAIRENGYHGASLVSKVLAQIAASRFGIAEFELLHQLDRDGGVLTEFLQAHPFSPPVATLPPIVWYRLAEDIREFLSERVLDGIVILDFFHQSIDEAVKGSIGPDEIARHHRELAELYSNVKLYPRWLSGVHERSPNERPLRLLPYHLAHAGATAEKELNELLNDFDFLMAKCQSGKFEDLLNDFRRARSVTEAVATNLKRTHDFLSDNAHLLRRGDKDWPASRILLQLASEASSAHPIRQNADAWLREGRCQWFWLRNTWQRPHVPGLHALQGHTSTPNGFIVVNQDIGISWSTDGTIRSWELDSGRLLREFWGHEGIVSSVILLPPNRILSWGEDETVRCWDIASARELASVRPHDGKTTIVRPLRDGQILSYSRDDQTVRIWTMSAAKQTAVIDVRPHALNGSIDGNSLQRVERFFRGDLYLPMLSDTDSSFIASLSGGLLQLDPDHFATWGMGGVAVWSIAEASRVADISWFVHDQPSRVIRTAGSTLKILTSSGGEYEWDWHDQTAKRLHAHNTGDAGVSDIDGSRLFVWTATNPEARHQGGPDTIEFRILNRNSGAVERTGLLKNYRTDTPSYFRNAMSLVSRGIFQLDHGRLCAWSSVGVDVIDIEAGRVDAVVSFELENFMTACALLSPSEVLLLENGRPLRFDIDRKEVTQRFGSTLNNIREIKPLDHDRFLLIDHDGTLWIWNAIAGALDASESPEDFLASTAIMGVAQCEPVGYGLVAVSYRSHEQAPYVDIFVMYPIVRPLKRVRHAVNSEGRGAGIRCLFKSLNQLVFSWASDEKIRVTEAYSGVEIQMPIPDGSPVVSLIPFYLQPCGLPPFGSDRGEALAAVLTAEGSVYICAPYYFDFWAPQRAFQPAQTGNFDELKFEHNRWLLLRQNASLEVWDASSVTSLLQRSPVVSFNIADEPLKSAQGESPSIIAACVLPAGGVLFVMKEHSSSNEGESGRDNPATLWLAPAGVSAPIVVGRFNAESVQLFCAVDDQRFLFSTDSASIYVCDLSTREVRTAVRLKHNVKTVTPDGEVFTIEHENGATTLWRINDDPQGDFLVEAIHTSDWPTLEAGDRRYVLHSAHVEGGKIAQWHGSTDGKVVCTLQSGSFLVLLANGQLTLLQAQYGNEVADLYHVRRAPAPPAVPWMAYTNVLNYAVPVLLESVNHLMRVGVLDRVYELLDNPEKLIEEEPLAHDIFFRLMGEHCRFYWTIGQAERAKGFIERRDDVIESLLADGVTTSEYFDRDIQALKIAILAEQGSESDLQEALTPPEQDAAQAFNPEGGGPVVAAAALLTWNLRLLSNLKDSELPAQRRHALRRIAEAGKAHTVHELWNRLLEEEQQTEDTFALADDSPNRRADPDAILAPELYPDELKPALAAARQGDIESMIKLGRSFGLGLSGLKKNIFNSMAWYERANDHGSDIAAFNLAQIYRHGDVGLLPDDKASVHWLEIAAARGHVKAQTNLARALAEGKGVEKDAERARVLLEKSVAADDLFAYFPLALLYLSGDGIPIDKVRAQNLALDGARKGDANCARLLTMFSLPSADGTVVDAESVSEVVEDVITDELKARISGALEALNVPLTDDNSEVVLLELAPVVADIDRRVIEKAGKDLLVDIALLLHAYAGRLLKADNAQGALDVSSVAITATERLILDLRQYQHYLLLAAIFMNHGTMLKQLERWDEALEYYRKGIQAYRRVPKQYLSSNIVCQQAHSVIDFAKSCVEVEAYVEARNELVFVLDVLSQALNEHHDPEVAERMLNVESMLAVVDSRSDGNLVASERLDERLSTWLGQDAEWYGVTWATLLYRLIHQSHALRSSVHGIASAAKTANDQLDNLYRLVRANDSPGLCTELLKVWRTYLDSVPAESRGDEWFVNADRLLQGYKGDHLRAGRIRISVPRILLSCSIAVVVFMAGIGLSLWLKWTWIIGVPLSLLALAFLVYQLLLATGRLSWVNCPTCGRVAYLSKSNEVICPKCREA